MTGLLENVVVVGDVVIADTHFAQKVNAEVWVFDAGRASPSGEPRASRGAGDDTVYVYDEGACLVHALALDGALRRSVSTPPLEAGIVPVKVEPDGDGVIMVQHFPGNAPVVVGRVDTISGADVWRFQLPPTGPSGVWTLPSTGDRCESLSSTSISPRRESMIRPSSTCSRSTLAPCGNARTLTGGSASEGKFFAPNAHRERRAGAERRACRFGM